MTYEKQAFSLWGGQAVLLVTGQGAGTAARREANRVLAEVELACSAHRGDSELARVNAAAGRRVPVGSLFLEILKAALDSAARTGGLVDPTAPGRTNATRHDWRSIEVDEARGEVSLPADLTLDLGAIGKAFAADRVAATIAHATGRGVLVALAGDIAAAGNPPAGGWPVRVADDHRIGPGGLLPAGQDVTLTVPGGLATSSLAVRTRRLPGGETLTHIVDPRSGLPVRGPWRTVSVAAPTCVAANTATTAALVRGGGAARWLAESRLPARMVHVDGWVHTVRGWPVDDRLGPGVKVAG